MNLRAARNEGSWWNKATLGILGQKAENVNTAETVVNSGTKAPSTQSTDPSFLNRMSFGLLDRPDQSTAPSDYAPAGESLYDKQRPQN